MEIEVLELTPYPLDLIGRVAGTSTRREGGNEKRAMRCIRDGHLSVAEFATGVARVSGISRACSHQLVRHRHFSFCQESQRYTTCDFTGGDWFVTPPGLADSEAFESHVRACADAYRAALADGAKPEDARYLLPEATKTTVMLGFNARALLEFLPKRLDVYAQWEIRNLARELGNAVSKEEPGWAALLDGAMGRNG